MSLKITISGYTGDGKTTLAHEIDHLLDSMGMNVTVKDFDLNNSDSEANHEKRIDAMSYRYVLIETIQLQRNK